ncbi:MAG: regulatory iron-sulfur-containing complex subunit RicT [Gemmatimonadota bacterium]
MATTVEVRFKGNRKDYFLWSDEAEPLHRSDPVIVEADRGVDFGRVSVVGDTATKKCASGCAGCAVGETPPAPRNVVRLASQDEIRTANDLRRSEEDTRRSATDRVRHYELEMKISDAEWQWDRKKLTLYFTAEKRVDFRDLVRDLASTFKARIELRQIGVRDEAARLGGVGRCGKEYCCSTWLRELSPVSLSLAKDQHLSLNPAQISGGCGRLLCCLKYEHEFYVTSRKRFPKEGKALRTRRGTEKVIAVDIFRERVFLRHDEEGPRIVALIDLKDEIAEVSGLPEEAAPPAPEPRPQARTERAPRPPIAQAARPAAPAAALPTAQPAGADPQQPAADGSETPNARKKRSKRRRRRSPRPGGGPPPAPEA